MTVENKLLADAARDVPANSSHGNDPDNSDGRNLADPPPDGGNDSGDSGNGKTGGRTLDNLAGEFDRKMAKLEGMIEGLVSRKPEPAKPNNDINSMSSAELEAMASVVPEEQKNAFVELLKEKKTQEALKSIVGKELDNRDFAAKKQESDTQAFNMYPELHDSSSRFRQETNVVLNEMGEATRVDPRVLLHASQIAAQRLGLKRKQSNPFRGGSAKGNTGPANTASDADLEMSQETADKLAKTFARSMPGGKFSKERIAGARKTSALYRKHQDKIVR